MSSKLCQGNGVSHSQANSGPRAKLGPSPNFNWLTDMLLKRSHLHSLRYSLVNSPSVQLNMLTAIEILITRASITTVKFPNGLIGSDDHMIPRFF